MKKRYAVLLLSVVMCLALLCTGALAADTIVKGSYNSGVVKVTATGLPAAEYPMVLIHDGNNNLMGTSTGGTVNSDGKLTLSITTGALTKGATYTINIYGTDGKSVANESFKVPSGGSGSSGSSGSSSSSDSEKKGPQPDVSHNDGGSVKVSNDGKTVTITPDSGYRIKDVLINGKSVGAVSKYVFDKASTSNKVEVVFEKVDYTAINNFTDVNSHWAKDAILFVVEKDLFNGLSSTQFGPNQPMTRAMLVTVLHRLEDKPSGSATFGDVPANTWYSAGVAWAATNGIVQGMGNNTFAPNLNITREQLCVMFYNYAKFAKIKLPTDQSADMKDMNKVSSWATEAVTAMLKSGVINGKPGNLIDPQGTATRAEVATMFQRLLSFPS